MKARTLPLLAAPATLTSAFSWEQTKYLIAFGDSYSYVQGTAGLQDYSFIGDAANRAFTPQQLLSNQIVQNFTGTSAGGPNWAEHLTSCGVKGGLSAPATKDCPTKELWDFAFAGADVSSEYLPAHSDVSMQLVDQTNQYIKYGDPALTPRMNGNKATDALVAIWIGINDVIDALSLDDVHYPTLYSEIQDAIFAHSVQPLWDAGYRNFLFVNLPPLTDTPNNLLFDPNSPVNATMVQWWNDGLAQRTQSFFSGGGGGGGGKGMVYDAEAFLANLLANAKENGYKNWTWYCSEAADGDVDAKENPGKYGCYDLDEYFWYDQIHISARTHKFLADDMAKFLEGQSSSSSSEGGGGGDGGGGKGAGQEQEDEDEDDKNGNGKGVVSTVLDLIS